jgi:hypothetical protein
MNDSVETITSLLSVYFPLVNQTFLITAINKPRQINPEVDLPVSIRYEYTYETALVISYFVLSFKYWIEIRAWISLAQ